MGIDPADPGHQRAARQGSGRRASQPTDRIPRRGERHPGKGERMKHTEIERKFALSEPGQMRSRLARLNATLTGQSRQVDVYYNHPSRDFLAGDVVSEWLRLRTDQDEDGRIVFSVNFKQWLPIGSPEATHAAEYESVIGDHDAV